MIVPASQQPRLVLGLAHNMVSSSAALTLGARVVAGAAEERFSRVKHSRAFPSLAVRFCLDAAKADVSRLSAVAVSADPGQDLASWSSSFTASTRWYPESLIGVPHQLLKSVATRPFDGPTGVTLGGATDLQFRFIPHHVAHAAASFVPSPFENATALILDGRGEGASGTVYKCSAHGLEQVMSVAYPHSLGLLYGVVTAFLGFRMDRDEWKVMGMAAHAKDSDSAYRRLRELVELVPDGLYRMDLNQFDFFSTPSKHPWSDEFERRFGRPRIEPETLGSPHFDLAAGLQRLTEEVIAHCAASAVKAVGDRSLAVGGGVFMNSVANGKLVESKQYDTYVPVAPDDSGTAIGAALYVACWENYESRGDPDKSCVNIGPSVSDDDARALLRRYRITFVECESDFGDIADALAAGKVVGWFQGAMEFGQRALGFRSILADPRDVQMREHLNLVVKGREAFRPFGPAIRENDLAEIFYCNGLTEVRYMERSLPVRPAWCTQIPAAVHADGTSRPNTVAKLRQPELFDLLTAFGSRTEVPVLINTSFNLAGEPIVCTLDDAIRTFMTSALDLLVIGRLVVTK